MNNLLTTREIQLAEKDILQETINFLNKHNLRYSICGGTLIGAVRHEGFIPWDDDIDICMPRPDYDKLQKTLQKEGNQLSQKRFFHSVELHNLNMPFTKVYDYGIQIEDERYHDKYEKYLWIDIFPIDGLPSDDKQCQRHFQYQRFYRQFIMRRKMSWSYMLKNRPMVIRNFAKTIYKIIALLPPAAFWSKRIIKLARKYSYAQNETVGCFSWGYGPRERMPKKVAEEYIDLDFEGMKVKGFKNYDLVLTNIYGDYMQLPPVEKRITHSFKAWKVDRDE